MPLFSLHSVRLAQDAPITGTTSVTLLKRYRPLETLATGGFGSVEICLDSHLRRRVAIKRMPLMAEPGMPATAVGDALTEAYTAAMLQHPNIVQVQDFTYDSAYAYLVMEYVDGMSLADFLAKVDGNSLTFDEAAAIADGIGQALAFAHANGVLHLDIKPANVLIDRAGHVKLTDFGMARLSSAGGFGGSRGGTIGYMPPEQLDIESGTLDERADIFALACVLYEGLCGTAPFRAATPSESLERIVSGATWPSELIPRIPEGAEAVLMSALSPMPQDRPASVDAFCDRFLAGLGSVREGRRSLEHMVAELMSDERAEDPDELTGYEEAAVEVDPALGWAGTRWPDARRRAVQGIAGVSCAAVSFLIMRAMGVTPVLGVLAAAVAIGTAAGLAPQIGSAIAVVGFCVMCANATMAAEGILQMLPVVAVVFALAAGWWIAWGRTDPAASAVLVFALGLAGVCDDAYAAAGITAGVAAFLLPPGPAAAATGVGALIARLLTCSLGRAGVLGLAEIPAALGDVGLVAGIALAAGTAALTALLLERHGERAEEGRDVFGILAIAASGAGGALTMCLAHHMEIASLQPPAVMSAVAAGILSSILLGICLFLLGYQRTQTESDLS